MNNGRFSGVLVPVLTPFAADLVPDAERFIVHCRWLLAHGATGLAPFGTTSEANSLSPEERMDLLDTLIEAGLPPDCLMPGTGLCDLPTTVRLSQHAVERGCGAVLMLPPFYYKNMSDEGLFAAYAEVIERVADARLKIYLYHIPPQSQVSLSLGLIERLLSRYPETVIGLKDSGGDWANTAAVLSAFPDFVVFPGSETFLLQGLRAGSAGCITATGNVNPDGIRAVFDHWRDADADDRQARITEIRQTIQRYPLIPALKHMTAEARGDEGWKTVRPPMIILDKEAGAALAIDLKRIDFRMAGIGRLLSDDDKPTSNR